MLKHRRTIACLLGLAILVMLILVLAGCGRAKPTPTPTPEAMAGAATPVVTILKNPNITIVPAGAQVALAAETTRVGLTIAWRPKKGKVSNTEGPSTIYTAPAAPGIVDTVDVTVTSDTGSTNKTVAFIVIEALAEGPAPTNTSAVTPALTKTPTSAATNTPLTNVTGLTAPATTSTPVAPQQGVGTLYVKALEGCDNSFSIKVGDRSVGSGKAGTRISVGAGAYDVDLFTRGGSLIVEDVAIRKGEETVLDFTQELGILLLAVYPQFEDLSLEYSLYPAGGGGRLAAFLDANEQYCVLPGMYTIKLIIYGGERLPFDTAVKSGEVTVAGPETWPKQLGVISFAGSGDAPVHFDLLDQADQKVGWGGGWTGSRRFWALVGTYKVVITDPYPGLTYENVEIRAGEETVLQLPDQPSP